MWRAFFFAVGTMLIILGLECLVTERFVISQGRIPPIVAKVLNSVNESASDSNQPSSAMSGQGPNAGLAFGGQPNSPGGQAVSKYGPSRFDDNFTNYNQSNNYYGGVPSSSRQSSRNEPFSLAGFNGAGGNAIAPLAQPSLPPLSRSSADPRKFQVLTPKEWMPWSLLAAGSLVVLYTNSTGRGGYSND